jgi:hypothetical protein
MYDLPLPMAIRDVLQKLALIEGCVGLEEVWSISWVGSRRDVRHK